MEEAVRKKTGLHLDDILGPQIPVSATKQADAINHYQYLVSKHAYQDWQLGIFACDLGKSGAKTFFVDTFAHFCLESASRAPPSLWKTGPIDVVSGLSSQEAKRYQQHLYEVILDGRPCWLYFDLEFDRISNPGRDPAATTHAFYQCLDVFLAKTLGTSHDPSSVTELDSTTEKKYSKHVIIKRLQNGMPLAFESNAHAGVLVSDFIASLREGAEQDASSPAQCLLFETPKSVVNGNNLAVPLVDGCVYTRNRCFRVLFSSKLGKGTPLLIKRGEPCATAPPLQLLSSLVTFVPRETPHFTHPRVAPPLPSAGVVARARASRSAQGQADQAHALQGIKDGLTRVPLQEGSPYFGLFGYLTAYWDRQRAEREPTKPSQKTFVRSSVLIGDARYLCITLANNRFCLNKGASHKSNSIYFVVDLVRKVFYQKCHDIADCGRGFRSPEQDLPGNYIPLALEEEPAELEQAALSQLVEETQLVLSQINPSLGAPKSPRGEETGLDEPTLVMYPASVQNALAVAESLGCCDMDFFDTLPAGPCTKTEPDEQDDSCTEVDSSSVCETDFESSISPTMEVSAADEVGSGRSRRDPPETLEATLLTASGGDVAPPSAPSRSDARAPDEAAGRNDGASRMFNMLFRDSPPRSVSRVHERLLESDDDHVEGAFAAKTQTVSEGTEAPPRRLSSRLWSEEEDTQRSSTQRRAASDTEACSNAPRSQPQDSHDSIESFSPASPVHITAPLLGAPGRRRSLPARTADSRSERPKRARTV